LKELKDILYKAGCVKALGPTDVKINAVCFDSRYVQKNDLFVAVKGTKSDGHKFIDETIVKGAIAIVCEKLPETIREGVSYIVVENSDYALGVMASNYYDNPSSKLHLVGVTGTNGKTTIVTLLHKLFSELGYDCGLLSTIRNLVKDLEIPATHTTPDSIELNRLLKLMVDEGCKYCFIEVSSHAVVQNRIVGLDFAGGIFTNITHDHLDYHKTFEEYIKAKKGFFDMLRTDAFALSNIDDKNGTVMFQNTKAKKYSYSLQRLADFKCRIIENQFSGLELNIDGTDVWCKLVGKFNAYNLLAIYATAIILGIEKLEVLRILSKLNSAEGRFEYITSENGTIGIVDYAHTPDALSNVITTINAIRSHNEKLITVVGCGGDRDVTKRPEMAKIACSGSEKVILTSDNPRSEEPVKILEDMQAGVEPQHAKKVLSIENRKEAIKTACSIASSGDVILIAGKGHEKYQEIKGVRNPFDDKEILKEFLI
jgi:UDP-N-acetylmuramoyl-L-alanyl-D-glutamate--2,6-diaminopimelate ligase